MDWVARYNDGTSLSQYNEDGSENSYFDIDRRKLSSFELTNSAGGFLLCLHLDPDQRLIFRRRVMKRSGYADVVVYLVGWQMSLGGRNVQSISYLTEKGEIHVAGAWRDDHPWFYSIQPVPCEEAE